MRARTSWSKGAKSALQGFQNTYGEEAGTRAFYAYANKVAAKTVVAKPLNQRVSKVYAKGNQQQPGKGGTRKKKTK
jgi:hypothetical protein